MASNSAAPSTANEPDHTGSPRAPHRRFGLAGQIGLVQGKPVGRHDCPVGDHLVAGRHADEVSHHHVVERHAAVDPVADHNRVRSDQRGEPVERPLGADLLKRPDRDVRDQDPDEQSVPPRPEA